MPLFRSGSSCIFCKIAAGSEKTKVIRESDNVVVFKDIHPVAEFHLLAVPKCHLADAKSLDKSHSSLVAELVDVGELTMQDLIAEAGQVNPPFFDSELRVGFHWPPFISVSHLHLHLIYPASTISGLPKYIGEFHPRAWWFRSPSWVLDRIAAIEPRKSTSLASADHSPSTLLPDKSNEGNTVKEEGEEQQEQKEEEEVKQEEQEINEEPILRGDGLEQQQKQQQQSEELGSLS